MRMVRLVGFLEKDDHFELCSADDGLSKNLTEIMWVFDEYQGTGCRFLINLTEDLSVRA